MNFIILNNNKEKQLIQRVINLLEGDRSTVKTIIADGKVGYSYIQIQDETGEVREIKLSSNSAIVSSQAGQVG